MARRKKRSRKKAKAKLHILPLLGMAVPASHIPTDYKNGGVKLAVNNQVAYFTGYVPDRNKYEAKWLARGTLPVVGGILASEVASKIGINKAIARKMPWLPFRL